jgi:hypothetical protein
MEILAPTDTESFMNELHIVDHSENTTYELEVASFESILSIKQQITVRAKDPLPYLPEFLFLAIQSEDGSYTPIEFQYVEGFTTPNNLPDPLTYSSPDRRFVSPEGSRIILSIELYKGLSFEQIPFNGPPTLHVWTLRSLAAKADPTSQQDFLGYFQVYFPLLQNPHQVEESLYVTMTTGMNDTFLKLQEYQRVSQSSLDRMDIVIPSTIESLQIKHITVFHAKLPILESVKTDGLDIVFHGMKGSKYLPYIRYFPHIGVPTLKTATGPSGVPLITNPQVFRIFSSYIPSVEHGSVLMIKTPIESQNTRVVQKGFAWTLLISSDGSAELQLDSFRRDDPIPQSLLLDAFEILPSILSSAGWDADTVKAMHLSKFSGVYKLNLDVATELNVKELQKRVKQYAPFLYEESHSKINGVTVRSRVGTILPQEDPIQQAIELYRANKIIDFKQTVALLIKDFGISVVQAAAAFKLSVVRHREEIELYGTIRSPSSDQLGGFLYIEVQSSQFYLNFEYISSYEELQRLITIAKLIIVREKIELSDKKKKDLKKDPLLDKKLSFDEENENAFSGLLEPSEIVPAASKENYNYINYLLKADDTLFKFTSVSKEYKAYTTICQRAQHRQPYVLSPVKYKDVKEKYKGRVHMLEYPLSDYNAEVVRFVSSTADERRKYNKKSKKEKEAMEIHGLRLGIPLIGNESFLGEAASPMVNELIKEQQLKELWVFARAGSSSPNYYVCSKLWCATDQIPVLESEYEGDIMNNGAKKKLIPSCPYCGEQNVIERKDNNIYVGYFNKIKHPEQYILPCCFKSPDKLELPKEAIPIPNPPKGLEPVYPDPLTGIEGSTKQSDKLKDLGAAFKRIHSSSIYILRSATILTAGTIGVVPAPIDSILGQSVDSYTTVIKGNPKLQPNPHAFIRFGIYGDGYTNGQNFLQFLSYLLFSVAKIGQGVPGVSNTSIMCPMDILKWLTITRMIDFARAFEAANYGTLIYEFYDPAEPDPGQVGSPSTLLEFQIWMGKMLLETADRSHVIRFFKAWTRFIRYLKDPHEPKELRLWDGILSTPGLFSKDGIVLTRIIPTYSKEGDHLSKIVKGEITCPPFGISQRTREGTPCLVPIYYLELQSVIEPLIYIEDTANYIGAIHPSNITKYSVESRKKLLDLYYQYLQPIVGCGRPIPPIHAWLPDNSSNLVRLGILLDVLEDKKEYTIKSILRERTNRVVGVLVEENHDLYYIPVSDDGTIDTRIPSKYDIDALPKPPYPKALVFFTKLSKTFSVLKPFELRYTLNTAGIKTYIQLDLFKNTEVPIEPFQDGVYETSLPSKQITQLRQEDDLILLKKADEESMKLMKEVEINSEELLEEAYQYLRISLSNWLIREGHGVARQIELLRNARSKLPLYELRKRGDLLLHGIVQSWITTEGEFTVPPLLRQNCILLKEGDCSGMCSWSDGRCKIHAPVYGSVRNPVTILTARLVDELLRTNGSAYEVLQKKEARVSRLRPPTGIVKEGDTQLVSFDGRGTSELYKQLGLTVRHPTTYTQGYRYPEEVSAEDLGREIATESGLPVAWEDAGWARSGELPDIVRKLPELQDAILRELLVTAEGTKLTYTAFEKELKHLRPSHSAEPFSWSEEDLNHLSFIINVNIILTNKNIRTGMLEFKHIIRNSSPQYILLDDKMIPLLYHPSGAEPIRFVELDQLPEDVQLRIEV